MEILWQRGCSSSPLKRSSTSWEDGTTYRLTSEQKQPWVTAKDLKVSSELANVGIHESTLVNPGLDRLSIAGHHQEASD